MKDILNNILKLEFIDSFHNYSDPYSNIRLYHWLKANLTKTFIEENVNESGIFLDAGAGRGPYTKLAKENFAKIFCYEFNKKELEAAKDNIRESDNIEFSQVDLTSIPLEEGVVDVCVCSEVLEHIPDYIKAAEEIHRVMKPGGKLLLSMPNNRSLFYLAVKRASRGIAAIPRSKRTHEQREFMRHQEFSHRDIEKIACESGFEIISRRSVNIFPLPYKPRKLLMQHFAILFKFYIFIDFVFGLVLPRYGSFYFLELKK